jgi:hypothetical protein
MGVGDSLNVSGGTGSGSGGAIVISGSTSTNLEREVYIIGGNAIGEIPNSGASILISSGEGSEDRR